MFKVKDVVEVGTSITNVETNIPYLRLKDSRRKYIAKIRVKLAKQSKCRVRK